MPPFSKLQWLALLQAVLALLALLGWLLADSVALFITLLIFCANGLSLALLIACFGSPTLLKGFKIWFEQPWRATFTLFVLWGMWLVALWGSGLNRLPPLGLYLPFAFFWSWLVIGFWLLLSDASQHRRSNLARWGLQVTASTIIFVLLLELMLRLFSGQLPVDLRSRVPGMATREDRNTQLMPLQMPVRNYWWAGLQEDFIEDFSSLDLYEATCLPRPLGQNPDGEPYRVQVNYDQYGFRGDVEGTADIVVIGDSFTHAGRVNEPFWANISPSVYGMGAFTTGTLEQVMNLEDVGLARQPKVVILAFFEGNDLQDNMRFKQVIENYDPTYVRPERSLSERYAHFRPLRFLATYALGIWAYDQLNIDALFKDCPFPITDSYGTKLGLLPEYLSLTTVETATLRQSEVFAVTRQAILKARDLSEANGAEFMLLFIPTTNHVHWAGLIDVLPSLNQAYPALQITASGFIPDLSVPPQEVTARSLANVDNQRLLLAELAQEENLLFLDLTPGLQAGAAQGERYYFYGDTHFNQVGHHKAGELIRAFLEEHQLP